MNQYISEVEQALATWPRRTSSQNPESYIGGGQSKLRYIGLRVPQLQQTQKRGFSFSNHNSNEIAKVWNHVWQNSDCYEVMALALAWFYAPQQRSILLKHWPLLKKWSTRIDNWAHSDSLSGIYARILEDDAAAVYPTLQKWNTSPNPWLRRLSIVSLFYYSSQRTKVPLVKHVLPLVEALLLDKEYYVQKGVGWTLRETYNVYPDKASAFLEKHIASISAHAFSAATEKMPKKQKEYFKRLRKTRRSQG